MLARKLVLAVVASILIAIGIQACAVSSHYKGDLKKIEEETEE